MQREITLLGKPSFSHQEHIIIFLSNIGTDLTPSHLVKRQGGIVVDKGFEQQHCLV